MLVSMDLFMMPIATGALVKAFNTNAGMVQGAISLFALLLAALLGLSVLLQLPLRSRRAPEINWGAPHTAERFAWTVSAKLFARTAKRSLKSRPSSRTVALGRYVARGPAFPPRAP